MRDNIGSGFFYGFSLRRVAYGLLFVLGFAPALAGPSRAADTITVASVGGVLQDSETKALYEPTAKALGISIDVQSVQSTARIAGTRQAVRTGVGGWDIVELFGGLCEQVSQQGLSEPLDFSVVHVDGIPGKLRGKNWVGIVSYSTLLAYNTKTYGQNGPKTWADFWNVKKFPGRRALIPRGNTVEASVLATGVPPDKLYPIDLDVAFKQLEAIKPYVSVWSNSTAHSQQLAESGEVDMLTIAAERVQDAVKNGATFNYTWNGGFIGMDCIFITKGSKHKDLAMKVLASVISPDLQANLAKYTVNGPVNAKAFDTGKITPEQAARLNTSPENAKVQIVEDVQWQAQHLSEIQERFDQLLQ